MKTSLKTTLVAVSMGAFALTAASAQAADKWWPVKVYDASSGENVVTTYSPLEKASKPWNLCVSFPHMKDSFWVAVAYGIVSEAKRQGVNMTLLEAGGYENLPRQLSQIDDCIASNADAIIVGPISEAGLAKKFEESIAAGKPLIATVNPVKDAKTTAKMYVEFDTMGEQTGAYLLDHLDGKPASAVAFPGPAGSGWAESFYEGFQRALKGSNVKIETEMFGDTGVGVQLKLIQDALQAYPDMTVIWGSAPTAEAAIGAVAEIGRSDDMMIMSSYENQAMLDAMNDGEILGFATQYPVLEGMIAVDMAIRALEGKELKTFLKPIPDMIAKANADQINMDLVLAPATWKPEYSVTVE
ncbi:MAG: TMAO reductase system periplasmic protein TorT [Sneathiella sp.]|nr:MAG: TMAO reductase system periplasmic protein TorT [Sneathiella sp.]